MTAIGFDSLSLVKRLRITGRPQERAEAVVDVTRDALASVATRDDVDRASHLTVESVASRFARINECFAQTDQRLTRIEQRLSDIDHRFVILEQRMTFGLGIIVLLALGAFIALPKWSG